MIARASVGLLLCAGCASGPAWTSLFDGQTLGSWTPTDFGGQGEVTVRDGAIVLDWGNSLTGITWQGDAPTDEYEIALEAKRVDGSDFFCGLTFPVRESHCSLILGGWGGTLVGLSSIDGLDASENGTATWISFVDDRPYAIRVRVSEGHIGAWLDNVQIIDQEIEGREIGLRPEVELSRPLGVASFTTIAELRDLRIRELR